MKEVKKTVLKSIKWSSIGNVGLALFQILQISILTRFLPKEVFGLVAIAVFVVNFTNLFVEMGITSAIFYKQDTTKRQYSSLYWLNIFTSLILYFGIFFLAEPISVFYNQIEVENIIKVLGLNIVFISIGQQHRALLQKKMIFDVLTKIDLFSYFIGFISAIILAWNGFGVYSLIYSTLITSAISSIILVILRYKKEPIRFYFRFSETKPFLNVGVFSLGSNILDFLSREIDVILIGKFFGSEILGGYSLAKQVTLKLYSVTMPIIFKVFNPLLASMNKQKDQVKNYYLKILSSIANLTFPMYLIVILLAEEILTILYGEQYKEFSTILVFLAVFQASFTIVKPAGSLQIATGRTDIGFYWTILRNVLTISMLYFVTIYTSINFVAISLAALSVFLIFILWIVQIKKMISISFNLYVRQFVYPLLMFCFVLLIKCLFIDNYLCISNIFVSIVAKLTVGMSIYVIGIYLLDKRTINNIKKYFK